MTLGVGQLQFIDSLQFKSELLNKLLLNLSLEDLIKTRQGLTDTEVTILQRKGVYT